MAEENGTVFGPKATEQIGKTVRENARRMMNETPRRARWQQRASSPGVTHTIWFTITGVTCSDNYGTVYSLTVEATWYNLGCTQIPPGENYDGSYTVYDICGYAGTADNILGTTGRATYMYPLAGYCEPQWIIDDLCYEPACT